MKTVDTLDQLIAANQAVKTNRTPSLDAAFKSLLHAKEHTQDHQKLMAAQTQQQEAQLAAKQAEVAKLQTAVTEDQAAAAL